MKKLKKEDRKVEDNDSKTKPATGPAIVIGLLEVAKQSVKEVVSGGRARDVGNLEQN